MPLYTYRCADCSQETDFLVGVNQDKTVMKCPRCGSRNMTRLLSSFSIAGSAKATSQCSGCSRSNCSGCSG